MSAANVATRPPSRRAFVGLASVVACGIGVGWLLHPSSARSFDYVYALLSPLGMAMVCTRLLLGQSKHSRWFVPLALIAVMLTVWHRPHVPAVSVVGFVAGAVAIVTSFRGLKYTTLVSVLLCCAAIAISMFAALVVRG
jgi:hypothetical protein